jgi:hypothetical protein
MNAKSQACDDARPVERHFYHSFPRVRLSHTGDQATKIGLEILKSIRTIGLVLAPEIVVWNQALQNGQDRTTSVWQRRICFTELSRDEVATHAETFGLFSLELRIDALRKLGALPVFYVPQRLATDRGFSTAGETIVTEIGDMKHTITKLHELSQIADLNYSVANLHNTDSANNVVASYQVPLKNIRDILNYLGYRNAPYELMIGILSHIQSLFYPTDDKIHDKQLDYYRQREWRLCAGLTLEGKPQSRSLTDVERRALLTIDEGFWSKEVSDGKVSLRRIDDARVIDNFEGRHIAEVISTVMVPASAYDEARGLFGDKVLIGENGSG